MTSAQKVEKAALRLDTPARAKMARSLIASLESLSEEEVERLWVVESETRLGEFRAGKMKSSSSAASIARVKRLLKG